VVLVLLLAHQEMAITLQQVQVQQVQMERRQEQMEQVWTLAVAVQEQTLE
jgi:hypothetical protein